MSILSWNKDGKSIVSTWGPYGLRVKRLAKGKYWWVLTGLLPEHGKRQVKIVDGIAGCSKVGRNEVEAALCKTAEAYRYALVGPKIERLPWYKRPAVWKLWVGRWVFEVPLLKEGPAI